MQSLGNRIRRAWPKRIGLVIWLALVGAYGQYTRVSGITPAQTVQRLVESMASSAWGVILYILAYMLQPVLFFPATLLTLAAGYLYGPFYRTAIVIVASNLSSMVAYFIGRFFGAGVVERSSGHGVLQQYADRLRRNSFETVLVMRFLFLPYDLVSLFSGFLRVRWQGFLLTTVLGSIPGTISFIALFDAKFSACWQALNDIEPALWRDGQTYPENRARMQDLFANGEVLFDMAYNPAEASSLIAQGKYPAEARSFVFDEGTIGNTHYVAIPYNSPHKAAAMVTADFLLSPEAQFSKAGPQGWGDLPVLNPALLPADWQQKFNDLPRGPATLPDAVLAAHRLPELPAAWLAAIEKSWEANVLKR